MFFTVPFLSIVRIAGVPAIPSCVASRCALNSIVLRGVPSSIEMACSSGFLSVKIHRGVMVIGLSSIASFMAFIVAAVVPSAELMKMSAVGEG